MKGVRNKAVKATLAAAMSSTLLLGFAAQAQASTYSFKWNQRTMYVYVDRNVSPYWYINSDIAQWSAAGGINVYRTYDINQANIRVHQKDLPAPNAAQTAIYVSDNTIVGADVTLDSTALNLAYCSRRHIATHELGHTLGLAHNYVSPTSVEYDGRNGSCSIYPNSYDYRDVRSLYPY